MLPLLFQDHGDIGADIARSGFSGEQKTGAGWHAKFHGAGNALQLPIAVGTGVPGNSNAAGDGADLQVTFNATDFDRAAGGRSLHAIVGPVDTDGTGSRVRLQV